ncbi:hypothetical protein NLG97_g7328 [Lecanicillium saksenae]|uniref:Uncharacterized protein n=1 Tax=Lecanicillium saksenae TaxID=468837 RepID=A0ACC1QNT2_9HYPO|nr:hypothetical protein NLG97_g7328 [Lecanicillium saksenae]
MEEKFAVYAKQMNSEASPAVVSLVEVASSKRTLGGTWEPRGGAAAKGPDAGVATGASQSPALSILRRPRRALARHPAWHQLLNYTVGFMFVDCVLSGLFVLVCVCAKVDPSLPAAPAVQSQINHNAAHKIAPEALRMEGAQPRAARSATILPNFVGLKFEIHNGKDYHLVSITEDMVGHKLGEFAPTRKPNIYGRK